MPPKPQTEKQKAHQAFKMHKAGMKVTPEQERLVKRYFPFMRGK